MSQILKSSDRNNVDNLKKPTSTGPLLKPDSVSDTHSEEDDENEIADIPGEVIEKGQEDDDEKRLVLGMILESFRSSLLSNNESAIECSLDSWDLPVGPIPWDDKDKPIQKLLNYADLTLTEDEENGLLTDRIVAACSSYLTESPGNQCHIVAKVCLNNKNLNDIRVLGCHRFLQYVDLSWNNITDLTPLGCLPYLMYLDVSHNLLEEVLRFRPPLNLTYVNYSHNEVWQIDDLTDFWALCYLDLSHNKISKIQGFHNLRYLRHLDLSHNKIERFENLSGLRITDLNLEYNLISKFEMEQGLGLRAMPHLGNLYLNNNLITSLEFIQDGYSVKKLDLQGNNISDLFELTYMKCLRNLRYLDMSGNPVTLLKPYRNLLLNYSQDLIFLDQTRVDISERVAVHKGSSLDMQLEAARNNARMILLEQLNAPSLNMDLLPIDQGSYPFVLLVGPTASSKKTIMVMLQEKYPDKIYIGKLHTTREIFASEKHLFIHLPKQCFKESIQDGKYLCVSENLGHLYGFSKDELGTAIKEHKICITAVDMISALTIHSYGIQPFMVLALPQSKEEHTRRLKQIYGPVLCTLGATYISQRQQINSHEANISRVQLIVGDIVKTAMDRAEGEIECQEESVSIYSSQWASAGKYSESELGSDDTSSNIYSHFSRRGCSPTLCDYQAHRTLKESPSPLALERFSASLSETKGEMTTSSSYSQSELPPIKVEFSSSAGSSFGETDPFLNWSMPFMDWSEINISVVDLEQFSELLCERYMENVLSRSDLYQNVHLENPGLFSLSISTDDVEEAVKKIGKFLKEIWCSTPNRKPIFDLKQDVVYQEYVPRKLEQLKEMLRKDFLKGDGDGVLKGFSDVADINSPASICAEMRLKGYDEFSENL